MTSCQITGLKNGKTYSFKVQAKNEVGWSKESNGVEGTPDKLPDAPTDVKAEASKNTITVTWKALEGNFSAVDKYQVTLSGPNVANPVQEVTGTSITFKFDDNAITDGASYTATVKAHNKVNWSQPSTASNAVSPWGTPDNPTISADQSGDKIVVRGRINDARNSKYQSITVSIEGEDKSVETSAKDYSVEFDIKNEWYYRKLKPTITVVTERSGSLRNEASVSTFTAVDPPTNVKLELNNNTCVATWSRKGGRVTGFVVKAKGYYDDDVHESRAEWPLSGDWSTCDTVSVQQYFIDTSHLSDPAIATDNTVGNKKPAEITLPSSLTWDTQNANIIHVNGGSWEAHGRSVKGQIVITPAGESSHTYDWPANGTLDVSDITSPSGTRCDWEVRVITTAGEPEINATKKSSDPVTGVRYEEKTPDPEPGPTPDNGETQSSIDTNASAISLRTGLAGKQREASHSPSNKQIQHHNQSSIRSIEATKEYL